MIRRLEMEADEMASFVKKKVNKQWILDHHGCHNSPGDCLSRG
jgi:hypothetical protein